MPIDLIAGEIRELNVAMTPIAVAGDLFIKQFFVLTWRIGLEGDGDWEIHCVIHNPTKQPASGTIHCTGELHRAGGFDIRQIDVTEEVVVDPGKTHRFSLQSRYFPHCQYMDYCWAKIDTSWGESTERQPFYAGYFGPNEGELRVLGTGTNYARIRFGHSACVATSESNAFEFYLKTPPAGAGEHVLSEKCWSPHTWSRCYLGCYFYAYPLLSQREYYVHASNRHVNLSTTCTTK